MVIHATVKRGGTRIVFRYGKVELKWTAANGMWLPDTSEN